MRQTLEAVLLRLRTTRALAYVGLEQKRVWDVSSGQEQMPELTFPPTSASLIG